jgi:hypothetical protein
MRHAEFKNCAAAGSAGGTTLKQAAIALSVSSAIIVRRSGAIPATAIICLVVSSSDHLRCQHE